MGAGLCPDRVGEPLENRHTECAPALVDMGVQAPAAKEHMKADPAVPCVICAEDTARFIPLPCMHLGVCRACYGELKLNHKQRLSQCMVCRQGVSEYAELHFAMREPPVRYRSDDAVTQLRIVTLERDDALRHIEELTSERKAVDDARRDNGHLRTQIREAWASERSAWGLVDDLQERVESQRKPQMVEKASQCVTYEESN